MIERYMVAVFDDELNTIAAVRDLVADGHPPLDVYTPYFVHDMDAAMGLKHTRLPWVCAIGGFLGAGSILFFQYWTSAVDWLVNIGGKPFFSLPAFVPVTFEIGILLAALGTVGAFLVRSRLYPGKDSVPIHPRVTDDRFVIVLEELDASFDRDKILKLFHDNNAIEVEERPMGPGV